MEQQYDRRRSLPAAGIGVRVYRDAVGRGKFDMLDPDAVVTAVLAGRGR
jgi:hypothetical protein